jgi:hypothetical protein
MRRSLIFGLSIALAVLVACSRGGASGGQVTAESVAMDFVEAVVAGEPASAESFLAGSTDAALTNKIQDTVEILRRYTIEDLEIASNREWRSGQTDRRIEIRFTFRPKEAAAGEAIRIGLITVRTQASGGLFSVSDVILDRPAE